jgi:hypothetical protein
MASVQDETNELIEQVRRLTQCYAIWWEVVSTENKSLFPEIRERHSCFFEPVQYLLAQSFFIICYQLFDHRADSKHITGLIKIIGQNNKVLAGALEAKITSANFVLQKITTIRHKVFAHRAKVTAPGKVFESANLNIDEMKQFVGLVQDIVSDLADAMGLAKKADVMADFLSHSELSREETLTVLAILHDDQA